MAVDIVRHLQAFAGLPWSARRRWLARRITTLATGRVISADRSLLEQRILPAYAARPERQRLLFVGCDSGTRHYPRLFDRSATEFHTIDIDPARRRYGAARHLSAALQDIATHFAPGSLDVIICNGVYGFGLNDRASFAAAMRACHASLCEGGELLLGWNNIAAYAPFDPSAPMFELGYERSAATPLGPWRVECDTPTRHTYDAYVRKSQEPE